MTRPLRVDLLTLHCLALGLPEPVRELVFARPRRWRFDYAWEAHRLALEVEGGLWTGGRHTRGKGYLGDLEKYNAATLIGWRLLRCTPAQVQDGTAEDLVAQALGRAQETRSARPAGKGTPDWCGAYRGR